MSDDYPVTAGVSETVGMSRKAKLRGFVYRLLPDGLMIALALAMVPVVVLPLVFKLHPSATAFLQFVDYSIVATFAVEYVLKAALAENVRKHVLDPWHLLDLIVVVLPLFDLLQVFGAGFGRTSPLLRLLRMARLLAVGGRTVRRGIRPHGSKVITAAPQTPARIRIMDDNFDHTYENASLAEVAECTTSPTHTWVDISPMSEADFEPVSRALGLPRVFLEGGLVEEAYPHIEYFEHYSMLFAWVPDVEVSGRRPKPIIVGHAGLLVICWGQNIITLSRARTDFFREVLDKARKHHTTGDSLVVSILHCILKYILEKDNEIITALEQQLIKLENIPHKERPADFLETTFHLRREVNQLVPSLLHTKEVLAMVTSERIPLEGLTNRDERLFDMLKDEAGYLHETAQNTRDNLLSLIDLYINTNSYELNRVMRIVAVITCLGILPAVLGLLGSNIAGNPWSVELWQVFAGLGLGMLALGWMFYRLGWFK